MASQVGRISAAVLLFSPRLFQNGTLIVYVVHSCSGMIMIAWSSINKTSCAELMLQRLGPINISLQRFITLLSPQFNNSVSMEISAIMYIDSTLLEIVKEVLFTISNFIRKCTEVMLLQLEMIYKMACLLKFSKTDKSLEQPRFVRVVLVVREMQSCKSATHTHTQTHTLSRRTE